MSDIIKVLKPLINSDVVIDCGGYLGEFTAELLKVYKCKVFIFEPLTEFVYECEKRFKNEKNVVISVMAISNYTGVGKLWVNKFSSSFNKSWAKSDNWRFVFVHEAKDIVKTYKPTLLKLNCEGEEYNIIENIGRNLKDIKQILVQFHATKDARYGKAQKILGKTHTRVYKDKWELWAR